MEFIKEGIVDRELEIGSYLVKAYTLKQIAEKTGLSKKMVSAHIRNLMEKLNTNTTVELLHVLKNKPRSLIYFE